MNASPDLRLATARLSKGEQFATLLMLCRIGERLPEGAVNDWWRTVANVLAEQIEHEDALFRSEP